MRDGSTDDSSLCGPKPDLSPSSLPGAAEKARFMAAYARILEALHIRTQRELIEILQVRQSAVSDAQRRAVIPGCWLVRLLLDHHISPQWILSGEGPRLYDIGSNTPLDPDEVDRLMVLVRG